TANPPHAWLVPLGPTTGVRTTGPGCDVARVGRRRGRGRSRHAGKGPDADRGCCLRSAADRGANRVGTGRPPWGRLVVRLRAGYFRRPVRRDSDRATGIHAAVRPPQPGEATPQLRDNAGPRRVLPARLGFGPFL